MRFLIKNRGFGKRAKVVFLSIFLFVGLSLFALGIGQPFRDQKGNGKSKSLMSLDSTCSGHSPPIRQFDSWTRVADSLYTYSAYLDNRTEAHDLQNLHGQFPLLIRIIGILQIPPLRSMHPLRRLRIKDETYMGDQFRCKIHYESPNGSLIELGTEIHLRRSIFEEGMKKYAGSFFNCYSRINFSTINIDKGFFTEKTSIFVSIVPVGASDYPTKLIQVRRLDDNEEMTTGKGREKKARDKLLVCVRPLFGPWDDVKRTAEFMAFYSAMGVEGFTFYDFGIAPRVLQYFNALVRENIDIRVLPWNLPTGNTSDLWDFGSLAALNDCVYRNYGTNTGIIVVDIDEFIVPGQVGIESLKALFFLLDRNLGEVLIRNSFFCKEFCENSKGRDEFQIFACSIRTKRVWSPKMRAKYFVNPRAIVSVGHHGVTRFLRQLDSRDRSYSNSLQLRPQHALLHHYRTCRDISSSKHPVLTRLAMPDRRMNHFKTKVKVSVPYAVWKAKFQM